MTETEVQVKELVARPYQLSLIDACIARNSIIFLPTGSGKSYIAIQVIKHFSYQMERKYSEGGKRSVFLVNTVCLAKQQAEAIEEMVPYSVCVLTGEQGVDYWKENEWANVLDNNEILVATAQVILDAVSHSFLSLDQVNVIVFDECHHGRLNHPYKELVKLFKYVPEGSTRIIGLSGMLVGNDNKIKPHLVSEELKSLEATFQSTIATVKNINDHQNVLLHSTKAVESFIRYMNHGQHPCVERIQKLLEAHTEKLKGISFKKAVKINPKNLKPTESNKVKEINSLFKDFIDETAELGAYGGYLSLLSSLIQLEIKKRTSDSHMYKTIVESCITLIEQCINTMENELKLSRTDPSTTLKNSSHKYRQLIALLKKSFNDPDREKDLQCIIFVKKRSTAKVLYHALKEYAKHNADFPVVPDFMVGSNTNLTEGIDTILGNTYNSITLEKFKNKETNCIVSTSVLEEGIDLQMCNLIVMFQSPTTYRSYVQARGRARLDKSNYVILLEQGNVDKFFSAVENYRNIDKTLKNQLLLKTVDREAPSEENIRKEQEDVWESFVTPISKSVLSNLNCISLLSCYAQKLPCDRFTETEVFWRRINNEDGTISAAIQLPSQCVIKDEIIGDRQTNVRLAKQHAAFKACIMLYEHGELSDNLVPCREEQKLEMHNDEYFSHWDEYLNDKKGVAGTKKHRRYHNKKTPKVLINSAPKVGDVAFLYRIMVKPKFDALNVYGVEVFKELIGNGTGYGILTSKRIPKLCKMSLFPSYGEVEVEISDLPISVLIEKESQLNILRCFHVAIFRDILKTWENYFVLDRSSYLIVPLTEYAEIDWNLAQEFQQVNQPKRLSYDEINATEFTHDEYYRRVVNPVYRETVANYVVLNVRENMTPLSEFPSYDYSNFKEYIETKFDTTICKTNQPMIEVKGISANLNLFFPGEGESGRQRRHEREQLNEFLIPEVCHNYKFPADFWLKAMYLPSICHRIRYLLFAEELRNWLIDEKIDEGLEVDQIYQLDVNYENYDQRAAALNQANNEEESFGKYPNRAELLKMIEAMNNAQEQSSDNPHTRALLLWDKSKLPIDIDRNWLTVTEVDLDYYLSFLAMEKNKISPASVSRLQQLNGSPQREDRFLMDVDDRSLIQMLQQDDDCKRIQQKDLIKVLTTSNAGDVFDMERYEVLGDGFLKFIVSLFLYKRHEEYHEGYLTTLKGKIVGNRNLFYIGDQFGLPGMIKATKFMAKETLAQSTRIPVALQKVLEEDKTLLMKLYNVQRLNQQEIISGEINYGVVQSLRIQSGFPIEQDPNDDDDRVEKSLLTFINQDYIGDKVIADAVEAFIGVVVQSSGIKAALKLCNKLKIIPQDNTSVKLLTENIPPRVAFKNASSEHEARVHNSAALEEIIGYKFKNPIFLAQAMTHASYHIKALGSYEQLEFLGDAVLDFLITCYITEQCPTMNPGSLTDLRSALVNNVTLACVVVRNKIHKHLLSESALLSEAIQKFVLYQTSNEHQIVLDQIIMLDTEDDTTSAESVDVPKAMGDIFESIIGAVFLDSGLNLNTTWQVIYGLLKNEIQLFIIDVPKQIVRRLFEFEKGKADPKFFEKEILDDKMIGQPLEFKCKGEKRVVLGVGKNKTLAKKCAAKLALRALNEH